VSRSESPSAWLARRVGIHRHGARVARSPRSPLALVVLLCVHVVAGCSSSDDVVAVYDVEEPTAELDAPSGAGSAVPGSVVQPVPDSPDPVATPTAGGIPVSADPLAPPALASDPTALRMMGVPASPPQTDAERWPLDTPLRQYFSPLPASASQDMVLVVYEPDATPLRELAIEHGLGEGLPPARVRVEDDAGEQFELTIWED